MKKHKMAIDLIRDLLSCHDVLMYNRKWPIHEVVQESVQDVKTV